MSSPRNNARSSNLSNTPTKSSRLLWVDNLRAIAIILMVIFHFCYDLRYFGYVDWSIPNGPGWWQFRYLILTLFIFTVGVSLYLSHGQQFRPKPFFKRLLQIALSAVAITIMSLFLFPNAWIYFGILHFIAAASIVGIVFVSRPYMALAGAAVILMGYWMGLLNSSWPFVLFEQWLPSHTEDFVPFFPWLGVMLLGVGVMEILVKIAAPNKKMDIPKTQATQTLAVIGKHGLLIYLLHQPILFAGFIAVDYLF